MSAIIKQDVVLITSKGEQTVTVDIDVMAVARHMWYRVSKSKNGRALSIYGAVKVSVRKPK